jgi:hypothetical protein
MQNPTTMKPAMPAPIISEGVDRGPDIPRFQRPTLDAESKRPTPDEENREVKKQSIEHGTPITEHRTPNGIFESNKGKRPTPNEENHEVILSFFLPSGR